MNAFFPVRPLCELATSIDYGVTASASAVENGTKFLRITDIQDGIVDWQTVPFCEAPANKIQSAQLSDGDIVFARTGATTGKSFLIQSPPDGAVFASYLIRVRPSARVNPAYLAHFFQSNDYWIQIRRKTQGAAQGGVNATSLSEIEIPLPPLDEQRRIAAILDSADALRRKRKRSLGLLDNLAQSIFAEMFGVSKGPEVTGPLATLADVSERIQIGPFGSILHREDYTKDGIPLINPMHIVNGTIAPSMNFAVGKEKYRQLGLYHLHEGDVILGRRGEMGRCAVVQKAHHGMLCGTGSIFVRPVGSKILPTFLKFLLSSPTAVAHFENAAAGVTMANLNKKIVEEFVFHLPSIDLQRKFGDILEKVSSRVKSALLSESSMDFLLASLQHRAFSGQL